MTFSWEAVPPVPKPNWPEARKIRPLMAISAVVTVVTVALMERIETTFVFSFEHSGQRMPTGVEVMQSVQIGRPQREQETAVSRFGCR